MFCPTRLCHGPPLVTVTPLSGPPRVTDADPTLVSSSPITLRTIRFLYTCTVICILILLRFLNCHSIYWHKYFDHVRKKAAAMKHLHNTCTFYEQKILSTSRKLNKRRKLQFQIKSGFAQFVIIHTICTISFLKAFYLSDTWLLTASGSIWQSQPHACSRSTVTRSSNPSGNIAKELFLSSGQVFRLDWMEASKVSYVINKVFFLLKMILEGRMLIISSIRSSCTLKF